MRKLILGLSFVVGLFAQDATQQAPIHWGSSLPATCNVGDQYVLNTTGQTFKCPVSNTWLEIAAGSIGYPANQPLSGCGVQYTTGLSFTVGVCGYTISGITYSSPAVGLTLSAADGTNPRIDAIIVDTTATASILTGTPAANPQQPTVDVATQLQLTFVLVPAGATVPSFFLATTIYDENTEWTSAVSANINCGSTTNPYHLTKDCEATTAALNNNFTLTKPAAGTETLSVYTSLVLYVRSKGTWPTGGGGGNAARSLSLFWLNGSTPVGQQVTIRSGVFGFDSSNTSVYQQVSIPISLFGTGSNLVTTLKVNVAGVSGSSTIGFYIDWITLQTGSITAPVSDATYVTTTPNPALSAAVVVAGLAEYNPLLTKPSSPNAMDDEFTGAAIDPKWTVATSAASSWTTSFNTPGPGWLKVTPATQSAGWAATQALPSGDFEFQARIGGDFGTTKSTHEVALGIFELQTNASKFYQVQVDISTGTSGVFNRVQYFTTLNTFGGAKGTNIGQGTGQGEAIQVMRVVRVGSNYTFYVGNGISWVTMYSGTIAEFTPGFVGIYVGTGSASVTDFAGHFDWFRRIR